MDNENKKELPLEENLPEEDTSFQDALAALRAYTAPEEPEPPVEEPAPEKPAAERGHPGRHARIREREERGDPLQGAGTVWEIHVHRGKARDGQDPSDPRPHGVHQASAAGGRALRTEQK